MSELTQAFQDLSNNLQAAMENAHILKAALEQIGIASQEQGEVTLRIKQARDSGADVPARMCVCECKCGARGQ